MNRTAFALLLCAGAFASPAAATDSGPSINPSRKAKIFFAGLSLARELPAAGSGDANVLVAGDCETADEIATFNGKKLNGRNLSIRRAKADAVLPELAKQRTAILFVCPDAAGSVSAVVEAAEKNKIVTLSDDPRGVQNGLMFGIEVREERAGLVLNITTAKAIGLDFDPRFFAATRIVK